MAPQPRSTEDPGEIPGRQSQVRELQAADRQETVEFQQAFPSRLSSRPVSMRSGSLALIAPAAPIICHQSPTSRSYRYRPSPSNTLLWRQEKQRSKSERPLANWNRLDGDGLSPHCQTGLSKSPCKRRCQTSPSMTRYTGRAREDSVPTTNLGSTEHSGILLIG